jgi:hypothetical protein
MRKFIKGRFLNSSEIIKKTDLVDMGFGLEKTVLAGLKALSNDFYFRPFKYKPKYRYLKTGEVIRHNDEIRVNFKPPYLWEKTSNCLINFNFTINKIDGDAKIFRRRRHIRSWVE